MHLEVVWVEEVAGWVHQGLLELGWQARAEVDRGVEWALERLRVVVKVAVNVMVMRHQQLMLALLTSSSRALLALGVVVVTHAQMVASDD